MLLDRLQNKDVYTMLYRELDEEEDNYDSIMISYLPEGELKRFLGMRISLISDYLDLDGAETILYLIKESGGRTRMVRFSLCEEDVRTVLKDRLAMVGSDGSALACAGPLYKGKPHPRNFGTFPRLLGYYMRSEKIMDLETAVYKMTGLPAWRLGLQDRGLLREGLAADITVFDPQKIIDNADFANPYQYPSGIEYVYVNGQKVIENGEHTQNRPGRILYKNRR